MRIDFKTTAETQLRARYKEQLAKFPLIAKTCNEDQYVRANLRTATRNLIAAQRYTAEELHIGRSLAVQA